MSRELAVVLTASLAALTVSVGYVDIARRYPRRYLPSVLLGMLTAGVYIAAYPRGVESKGPVEEGVAIGLCYLSMLTGMVAEYFYTQAERGDKKLTFDPMTFLMPIFASPIVFIPLLTITTDIAIGGVFTKAKLMVYLVAFQNGFFWKAFFEQRREKARASASALTSAAWPVG